jgi:hypothetical protein
MGSNSGSHSCETTGSAEPTVGKIGTHFGNPFWEPIAYSWIRGLFDAENREDI